MPSSSARPGRDVTRNDVARLAGVSSAVVSYVVNNGPRPVAEDTRRRVQEAIDKLGYRPNAAARSLITGRADLLGLIVPDVRNPYFAALAQAAETAARERGLNLVLAQGETGALAPLVESLSGHLVAGIITATIPEPAASAIVVRNRVPMVNLSLALPMESMSAIWPDYYGGARAAVEHLVEVHGHRSIALVIGSDQPERPPELIDERERGWRDALSGYGLATDHVIRVHWSAVGGAEAAQRLADDAEVTAAFVSSDQQAIGMIAGLHRVGRSGMALVSFDGSPEAEFTVPPLTTVRVPLGDLAAGAIAEVLGEPLPTQVFPTSLVVRESCGCGA